MAPQDPWKHTYMYMSGTVISLLAYSRNVYKQDWYRSSLRETTSHAATRRGITSPLCYIHKPSQAKPSRAGMGCGAPQWSTMRVCGSRSRVGCYGWLSQAARGGATLRALPG